jgi:cytochrome P450
MASQPTLPPLAPLPANVPPGLVVDLDMYNLAGIEEGYHEAWKRFQDSGVASIVWTPHNGGHWIATEGNLIRDIYRDYENFSSEVMFVPKAAGEQYDMIPVRMNPPEHTPFRAVLNKCLNLREIRSVEGSTREIAISLIEGFHSNGRCDFARDFANLFPVRVFLAMADLPVDDMPLLMRLASQMTRPEGATPEERGETVKEATARFFDYVTPYIEARTGRAGGDVISLMVNEPIGDRPISLPEAQRLISLVLLAGLDTTVNFLSFVMIHLARQPQLVSELTDDLSRIPRAAEELFRRFPVVSEARMVARTIECAGVNLAPGDMVLLPTPLYGLDERSNECPMKVDFSRKKPLHVTFGDGPHRCAGLHLARLEVIIMLQEWLQRIPKFRLAEGAKPKFYSGLIAAVENVPLEW